MPEHDGEIEHVVQALEDDYFRQGGVTERDIMSSSIWKFRSGNSELGSVAALLVQSCRPGEGRTWAPLQGLPSSFARKSR